MFVDGLQIPTSAWNFTSSSNDSVTLTGLSDEVTSRVEADYYTVPTVELGDNLQFFAGNVYSIVDTTYSEDSPSHNVALTANNIYRVKLGSKLLANTRGTTAINISSDPVGETNNVFGRAFTFDYDTNSFPGTFSLANNAVYSVLTPTDLDGLGLPADRLLKNQDPGLYVFRAKNVNSSGRKSPSVTETILINQGDSVDAGQSLTTGPKDPKEVLQINGVKTCQEYLVDEVQKTYRDQGVEVHDKHVEMIVRQMLRRVRIVKSNNSDFLPNELVDATLFRKTNQELVKDGKVPAEGRPELMGITKASLATDSWLSAASFQETTRVLTEAAMKRSNDSLSGLKENVIIGTLIPAGTGSDAYQSYTPSLPDAPEVSELGFMTSTTAESEEDALPNPAQWLAMLGEEKEEEDE